jgi:hypothetical protein
MAPLGLELAKPRVSALADGGWPKHAELEVMATWRSTKEELALPVKCFVFIVPNEP